MYKGASQGLQHRHGVDRPHPSRGYIDGASDPLDVLPGVSLLTFDQAKEEKRRLAFEVNRLEQELAVAKASGRSIAAICSQKATTQDRLKVVNDRIRELNVKVNGDFLGKAIREIVDDETAGRIFALMSELRRDSDGPRMAETNVDSARGEAGPARAEGIAHPLSGDPLP